VGRRLGRCLGHCEQSPGEHPYYGTQVDEKVQEIFGIQANWNDPIEPSTSKGKNVDPCNWGDVNLDNDKVDPETQQALLEEATTNNHNNEFDELHLEHLQIERAHQEMQNLYDKHKKSSKRNKKNRKPQDSTPLSKDMEKLIEDTSGGQHAEERDLCYRVKKRSTSRSGTHKHQHQTNTNLKNTNHMF